MYTIARKIKLNSSRFAIAGLVWRRAALAPVLRPYTNVHASLGSLVAARLTPPCARSLSTTVCLLADAKTVKVPSLAESISEGTLSQWIKKIGDHVGRDEPIAVIETDKVDVTVNAPESGKIVEQFAKEGDTVAVGGEFYKIELGDAPESSASSASTLTQTAPPTQEASPKTTESAVEQNASAAKAAPAKVAAPAPEPAKPQTAAAPLVASAKNSREEKRVKMNRMRMRIAERLKESQNVAASLTTFNEVDMSSLMDMRAKHKDVFLDQHGVKLGFMSAFVKAVTYALNHVPQVNARIEGDEMVYSEFHDISVAVATPKGLVTPVLRNCELKSFADVEKDLAALGKKARDNKIAIEDMAGGTFTISNGGVFGSLMGTPIINQPQSAILGMHAIKERAVAINGKVEIRPMMYLALTYDHRLIDGREAVTFLVKVKEAIEDPRLLLLS